MWVDNSYCKKQGESPHRLKLVQHHFTAIDECCRRCYLGAYDEQNACVKSQLLLEAADYFNKKGAY